MSLPIYQRVAVTDAGDVIPGAEYTVINENTGVAAPIYSDRTGATLLTAPYFADSVGTIQFFIAQGTTFRVAASGGVGTYTDRYVYGVAEAVLVDASGNVGIGVVPETWFPSLNTTALQIGDTTSIWSLTNGSGDLRTSLDSNLYIDASGNDKYLNTGPGTRYQQIAGEHRWSSAASGTADSTATVSDRMRIDSSGNIGIGTISPSAPLQVVSSENLVAKFSSSDVTSGIRIEDTTTSYDFYVEGGNLRINNTAGSESMRILPNGDILMGSTVTQGGAKLEVTEDAGNLVYFKNSAGVGLVMGAGGTAWVVASDERVKDIIEPITGVMNKLSTLRTVIGKYKVDPDGTRRPFLIAQDVQAVFPEVVNTQDDEDGTLGIEYTSLIPAMIAGMKEQQTLIEALTARIEALEAK